MSFKTFDLAHDVASLVSAINEVVSISNSLYVSGAGDVNVKFYENIASGALSPSSGGYWETVYDSSPESPQSTALFDITFGMSTASLYNTANTALRDEKTKVYRQMASSLLGGFDEIFANAEASSSWNECFFILIKRGLMKDELKKGAVAISVTGPGGDGIVYDTGASTAFKQTIGGDYALIRSGSTVVGHVYYNAGVIVLPAIGEPGGLPWPAAGNWVGAYTLEQAIVSRSLDTIMDGLRTNMTKLEFHNQTNLYSTVYFCRATNTDFNYSSNPTYVDADKRIRVTSGSNVLQSRTYVTTIGLYDANDNLLAVGKVNKPITKAPDTESIFRIRLDY